MSRLQEEKLHVRLGPGLVIPAKGPPTRRYTVTHSDKTGDMFLTIAPDYDRQQFAGWYTRLMRDEVLGEWLDDGSDPALHVYCHVSGGLVFGWAGLRDWIFRRVLSLSLETICQGDEALFRARPDLAAAPVHVHLQSSRRRYRRIETWGTAGDYRREKTGPGV